MTNYEIFYERGRNIENLSHFHGTRTSTLSWMHAKRKPDGGRRKRMSNSTLFLNGLSRSVMCLNAESDELNFSTLYTTIPHQKLKSRLAAIIRDSFIHKNGNRRYKFLVLGRKGPYFVKEHSDSKNKYTEDDIVKIT